MIANLNGTEVWPAMEGKREVIRLELALILDVELLEIIAKHVEPLAPHFQSVHLLIAVVEAKLHAGGKRGDHGSSHSWARLREPQQVRAAMSIGSVQRNAVAYLRGKQIKPHLLPRLPVGLGEGTDTPTMLRRVRRETLTLPPPVHHS